jgi:hypothetical protein
VVALLASASREALALSDGSLRPQSWALLIVALALRLRLWPLRWPDVAAPIAVLRLLTASLTGFYVMRQVSAAAPTAALPDWLVAAFVLSAAVSAVQGWLQRRERRLVLLATAGVVGALLAAATAMGPLAASWRGAPQLATALLLLALAPSLPLPRRAPAWVSALPAMLACALLLPLPATPLGRLLTDTLAGVSAVRPLAAAVATLALGLGLGAVAAHAWRSARESSTVAAPLDLALRLALPLAAVALALRLSGTPARSGLTAGAQALGLAATAITVFLAAVSASGRLPLPEASPAPGPLPAGRLSGMLVTAAAALEGLFRLIEGETSLAWATLIGIAILLIAVGI